MKEYLPIIFVIISGCCLAIIAIKNRIPFWGGLLSLNIKIQLSKTDKYLVFIALLFFVFSLLFLYLNY
jgi:hypothetical protein